MRFLLLTLALLAAGCAADTPEAPATAAPDVASTEAPAGVPDDLAALNDAAVEKLVQNEFVDVHRVVLAPGDSLAPHQGGERVVYALTPLTLRFTTDGQTTAHDFGEGEAHRHDAGVHSIANAGAAPASFVVFERRRGMLAPEPSPPPFEATGVEDDVVLNDAFAEVHRVTLAPGAALPPHRGYARAVYDLDGSDYDVEGEGGARTETHAPGSAHYHAPGDRTVENAGDAGARLVVVEFKR